jgi:hypothetical protein
MTASLSQWLSTQRVGYLAYSLRSFGAETKAFDNSLRDLVSALRKGEETSTTTRREYLRGVPRSVLWLLVDACSQLDTEPDPDLQPMEAAIRGLETEVRAAAHWLGGQREDSDRASATLHEVQMWAQHALTGTTSARWLLRLGRNAFGPLWRSWKPTEATDIVDAALKVIRDPWGVTHDRCSAVDALLDQLPTKPEWIKSQLRNTLYHHQFCWPLLTVPSTLVAASLPISVDISFDGEPSEHGVRVLGENGPVSAEDWRARLVRCVSVAKDIWRAKHGHHGKEMRSLVMSHKVVATIDFEFAQSVVAYPSTLADSSADAYLAQVVLARLLGKAGLGAGTSTGAIGAVIRDDVTDQAQLNYAVDLPDGIAAKVEYAFASRAFERVVLPRGAEESVSRVIEAMGAESLSRQSAEIAFVGDLHTMADVMHGCGRGWRQHRYVRSPDIRALLHPSRANPALRNGEPLPPEVAGAVAFLSDAGGGSIRTWASSAASIGLALKHLNDDVRTRANPIPPTLSWAFIRAVDYEKGISFWRTLWDVIGAPADGFNSLRRKSQPASIAACIAHAMNVFSPDKSCPTHRAPDVLVIVGSDALVSGEVSVLNPSARPFAFGPVAEVLATTGALAPLTHPVLNSLVGGTRIVLIPAEQLPTPADLSRIANDEFAVLRQLSAFGSEFTLTMAAGLLNRENDLGAPRTSTVRSMLVALSRRGLLAEGQGRYHIAQEVRAGIERRSALSRELPLEVSKRLLRAAGTLAPHIARVDSGGMGFDAALAPEMIHDAYTLLSEAGRWAQIAQSQSQRSACHNALEQHTLFTALPTWATVDHLIKAKNKPSYAYELALDLLAEQTAEADAMVHPAQLRSAARAAAQCARATSDLTLRVRISADAERLFAESLAACDDYPSERAYNSAVSLSWYATDFLRYSDPARAIEVVEQLCQLLAANTEGVGMSFEGLAGEAFEFAGDSDGVTDQLAADFYVWGCRVAPKWGQLWPKAVGSAWLAGRLDVVTDLQDQLRGQPDRRVFLAKGLEGFARRRRSASREVVNRFDKGLAILKQGRLFE